MEVVEEKAARVLRLIFRTSMNRNKGFGAMANENHEETAYRIATEGIVLLKMSLGLIRNLCCLFRRERTNVSLS